MKRLFCLLLVLSLALGGCSSSPKPVRQQFFAMDTLMTITAYGTGADEGVAAAMAEVNRLETLLSRTRDTSEISALNAAGKAHISADTHYILSLAQDWYARTGGTFDVTIAPVSAAWGFGGNGEYRVPEQGELDTLRKLVNGSALLLTDTTAALPQPGMEVDLGGIAKGYAAQRAKNILAEHGVDFALLDLGGNITALGTRPDGDPWRVAVRDPADSSGTVGILALTDTSAVTSGSYQRYFEENGSLYHHIIDPRSGRPANSGLLSATVVCPDPTLGDLLSTAVFVLGEEDALELWRTEGGFDLVLITDDGRLVVTSGLSDRFTAEETAGYTLQYAE